MLRKIERICSKHSRDPSQYSLSTSVADDVSGSRSDLEESIANSGGKNQDLIETILNRDDRVKYVVEDTTLSLTTSSVRAASKKLW